jgi:hypothetical protein
MRSRRRSSRRHPYTRRWRRVRPVAEAGQALVLVLGLVGMITIGAVALAQNASQHDTMVSLASLQHESYQALQAGIDEYLSAANTNPDFVTCDQANETSGFCAGALSFDTWTAVPGVSPTDGPPAWYWIADPVIDPATASVDLTVVGASGYPHDVAYQEGRLTLSALNDFLLNVLYIDYDQVDPLVLDPTATSANPGPTCGLYGASTAVNEWTGQTVSKTPNSLGPSSQCAAVSFIDGDTFDGSVWIEDAVFICGSPTFQALHTEYSTLTIPAPGGGCSDDATTGAGSTAGAATPVEELPTTDGSLATQATSRGCLFEGPTDIVLDGTQMSVYSPDTPTTAQGTDALDAAGDPSACQPDQPGTDQALPANGVIYVENCTSTDSACAAQDAYDPMQGLGETGSSGPTEGDALVQGTLASPLTIATSNNVIIDGDICYVGANGCDSQPSSDAMLGLIAQNFVEVNHPVTSCPWWQYCSGQYENVATCPSTLPTVVGSDTVPNCDLYDPVVDTVSLSLAHSFIVNNFQYGAPLGTLTTFGTIDEDWRGPVGTDSGGQVVTGYVKDYVYDPRLHYLAPPYYLNPGTSSWGLGAVTISETLSCPLPGCGAP